MASLWLLKIAFLTDACQCIKTHACAFSHFYDKSVFICSLVKEILTCFLPRKLHHSL